MSKLICCSKVYTTSDCDHVILGADEQEAFRKTAKLASEHGREPAPGLLAHVRASVEDE